MAPYGKDVANNLLQETVLNETTGHFETSHFKLRKLWAVFFYIFTVFLRTVRSRVQK